MDAPAPHATGFPPALDHLVIAAPDLASGIAWVEARLGVRAVAGGAHAAWGTHNALLALGPACYLEVIARDPAASPPGAPPPFELDRLVRPRLVTWAVRAEDPDDLAARVRDLVDLGPVVDGSRRRADGSVLAWRLTDPRARRMDGVVPFVIDWGASPHPAWALPAGGALRGLRATHPDPARVCAALGAMGAAIPVDTGAPGLVAEIRTANGTAVLD